MPDSRAPVALPHQQPAALQCEADSSVTGSARLATDVVRQLTLHDLAVNGSTPPPLGRIRRSTAVAHRFADPVGAAATPIGRIQRSTAVIRRGVDDAVTIDDVADEPLRPWQPPAEIVQPAQPLLLTDQPWGDVVAEGRRERDTRNDPRYQAKLKEISRDDNAAPNTLGPERYAPLTTRIDEQGKALAVHDDKLRNETGSVHGRARHGFQTGVDAQKRRAKNKMTPEQPSDPMGTGVVEKEWRTSAGVDMMIAPTNVAGNKKIVEGQPVTKIAYAAVPEKSRKKPSKAAKSGGPYAGGFLSPEHQNRLEAQALVKAEQFTKWVEAEFTEGGWKAFEYLDVVLQNEKGGYGVSFSKGKGIATAFSMKVTAKGLYGGGADQEPASSSALLGADDAGVDAFLMLCAKVQFKRVKGQWQVLSSFPENLEPGFSPIFNHGKDAWTGKVCAPGLGEHMLPAPTWLPDDEH